MGLLGVVWSKGLPSVKLFIYDTFLSEQSNAAYRILSILQTKR